MLTNMAPAAICIRSSDKKHIPGVTHPTIKWLKKDLVYTSMLIQYVCMLKVQEPNSYFGLTSPVFKENI